MAGIGEGSGRRRDSKIQKWISSFGLDSSSNSFCNGLGVVLWTCRNRNGGRRVVGEGERASPRSTKKSSLGSYVRLKFEQLHLGESIANGLGKLMGLEWARMVEKWRRSKNRFGARSIMADFDVVRFASNWLHIYTPHSPPTPWRKSTKAARHEAARIDEIGAGIGEEGGRRRWRQRDVIMTSANPVLQLWTRFDPGFWFGSVCKNVLFYIRSDIKYRKKYPDL